MTKPAPAKAEAPKADAPATIQVTSNDEVQAPAVATVDSVEHTLNGTVITTFVGVEHLADVAGDKAEVAE